MKHVLLFVVGVGIAVAIGFVLIRNDAVSPGGTNPSGSPTATPSVNITVILPKAGDTVASPITVTGLARTFEQNVVWRLRDSNGKQLGFGNTTATAPDIGQFGPYVINITVPDGASKNLTIEVFEVSARDGSEINKVKVPVTLQ